MTTSYKVMVAVYGEDCDGHGWHANALRFATQEEAEAYGRNLALRWTGVRAWRVEPDGEEPNGHKHL